jgi:hypothetical protein
MDRPIPREREVFVQVSREDLDEIHQVSDREYANAHEENGSARLQDSDESGNQHPREHHALFDLEKIVQAGLDGTVPGVGGDGQAVLGLQRHLIVSEEESQRAPEVGAADFMVDWRLRSIALLWMTSLPELI